MTFQVGLHAPISGSGSGSDVAPGALQHPSRDFPSPCRPSLSHATPPLRYALRPRELAGYSGQVQVPVAGQQRCRALFAEGRRLWQPTLKARLQRFRGLAQASAAALALAVRAATGQPTQARVRMQDPSVRVWQCSCCLGHTRPLASVAGVEE